ncbi:insulin precursor [Aplysia californica]|uniref:Insulin n=2 Tax=Gastropoda TaxID=6448 RepID=INS_APLCA|nr:insulin precursor [Aplysia californica]Q9NDE7.1 RecName: Full=Insulin; Contains: RecName: Full=Insulin B chain; Contains: RecName: Full=Insulin B chain'; Contains: RecName: Full=Insulin A chain; Flags: Precursor [Aplysia californica]AAF80383.1 insulin precursor [Aplysia californica]
MSKFLLQSHSANACLLTLLLTLASNLDISLANFEHSCNGYMRPHPRGLCGEDLHVIISNLCSSLGGNRRFLAKYMVKRDTENVNDKLRGILLNKKEAFSYLTKREASGSITCECCFNQCRIFELAQYCRLPDHFFSRISRTGRSNSGHAQLEDNFS